MRITKQGLQQLISEEYSRAFKGAFKKAPKLPEATRATSDRPRLITSQKLRELIRESVKELMNETTPGGPWTPADEGSWAAQQDDKTRALVKAAEEAQASANEHSDTVYRKAEKMSAAEIRDAIARHKAAIKAWSNVLDKIDTNPEIDALYNDEGTLQSLKIEDLINEHEDAVEAYKEFLRDAQAREAADNAVTTAGLKKLTIEDIGKIYRAAKSEYSSSYASMVDDALRGANNVAEKFGIRGYVDAGWFPQMLSYIERHTSWDKVPAGARENMLIDANADVAFEAQHRPGQKKKSLKKPRPV